MAFTTTGIDGSVDCEETEGAHLAGLPGAEARAVRRAWDDATHLLHEAGLPATFDTVCALVAAGRGYAARHAQRLIAVALEEGAR